MSKRWMFVLVCVVGCTRIEGVELGDTDLSDTDLPVDTDAADADTDVPLSSGRNVFTADLSGVMMARIEGRIRYEDIPGRIGGELELLAVKVDGAETIDADLSLSWNTPGWIRPGRHVLGEGVVQLDALRISFLDARSAILRAEPDDCTGRLSVNLYEDPKIIGELELDCDGRRTQVGGEPQDVSFALVAELEAPAPARPR